MNVHMYAVLVCKYVRSRVIGVRTPLCVRSEFESLHLKFRVCMHVHVCISVCRHVIGARKIRCLVHKYLYALTCVHARLCMYTIENLCKVIRTEGYRMCESNARRAQALSDGAAS